MSGLRESQLETLRFATKYPDGLGAWELAEFGPGGSSIRSAESRLERLWEEEYVETTRDCTYALTDKGKAAIRGIAEREGQR